MSELKNIFGVNDTDESLKGKSGGDKFGLNHGFVAKIEFTDTAGKDNGPGNAVDIWVVLGEREYRRRLYETTGALFGPKNTKVEPGEDAYQDLFYTDMGQKIAVIKHAYFSVSKNGAKVLNVRFQVAVDGADKPHEIDKQMYYTNNQGSVKDKL